MIVILTEKQLEQIIEALEETSEETNTQYSLTNYLKVVKQTGSAHQTVEVDDIPF
jgi:uncharacterized tellurite resistance protein B-like protein